MPRKASETQPADKPRRSTRQRETSVRLGESWAIEDGDDHATSLNEDGTAPRPPIIIEDDMDDDDVPLVGEGEEADDYVQNAVKVQLEHEGRREMPEQNPAMKIRRRRADDARSGAAEPDLVMPLLDQSVSMEGSWVAPKSRTETTRSIHSGPIKGSKSRQGSSQPLQYSNSPQHFKSRSRSDASSSSDDLNGRRRYERQAVTTEPTDENLFQTIFHDAISGLTAAGSLVGSAGGGLLRRLIRYAFFLLPFILFALWIRSYITGTMNSVSSSLSHHLSPICRVPGLPVQYLPICSTAKVGRQQKRPVEFDRMMKLQTTFEGVLEYSTTGLDLPLDMKRGEIALRDLRQRVRHSSLPAKNEILLEFDGFIDTSRMASQDLQRYNSHIGRAVDNVLATTRWTKRVLDDVAHHEASKGLIRSAVIDPLGQMLGRTPFTEKAVLDQYIQHARTVEDEINRLIAEAQALLMLLNNLEDRLDTIDGIVTREIGHAVSSKAEKFNYILTFFGHNKDILHQLSQRLDLLEDVGGYRRTAVEHVTATLLRLQYIAAGLEDLRERVATPALLRGRSEIPLKVHLDSIQSGVARLESSRSNSKRIENDYIRKLLGREGEDLDYAPMESETTTGIVYRPTIKRE